MKLALAVVAAAATIALPVAVSATEPVDSSTTVRLMAVGDLMLAGGIGARIVNDGAGAPWLGVASDLAAADLVLANLECTVSTHGTRWPKRNTFRAPVPAADSIVAGGIDIVHVANNHALDYGPTAFADTLRLLDERGVAHVGGGRNRESARAPVILERNGLRVAFLGYILPNAGLKPWYPGLWNATKSRAGLAVGTPETVAADVASALASADVVVVSYHGGMEHRAAQSAQVLQFVQAATSAGAALVIGHHPALLQGYRSEGTTLDAFSLGRFVSDRGTWSSRDSAILDVTLSTAGVESFSWIPIVIERGFPRPAQGPEIARIMARLRPI